MDGSAISADSIELLGGWNRKLPLEQPISTNGKGCSSASSLADVTLDVAKRALGFVPALSATVDSQVFGVGSTGANESSLAVRMANFVSKHAIAAVGTYFVFTANAGVSLESQQRLFDVVAPELCNVSLVRNEFSLGPAFEYERLLTAPWWTGEAVWAFSEAPVIEAEATALVAIDEAAQKVEERYEASIADEREAFSFVRED